MKKNDVVTLSMAERRAEGLLWVDTGENMNQQIYARGLCQDFNQTRATETEKREEILKKLLAFCGDNVWIEPPLTLAMGKTVSIGNGTYINSNLTLVDDYEIIIGEKVLIMNWSRSVTETSNTLTMLGWSRMEMALDSFLKRRTSSVFWLNSSRRIFTATTASVLRSRPL